MQTSACACALLLILLCDVNKCYCHSYAWRPSPPFYHRRSYEDHPSFDGYHYGAAYHGTPRDIMVDVVNCLGLKLLAVHNEDNENNIAISPYGAVSVLVALAEGLQGEAVYEIKHAAHLPEDISVIRVGLRDIHRHLKSYFIPKEGFLSGLTLNYDNVTLSREYEDILRFYGYNTNTFNNPLYPESNSNTTETIPPGITETNLEDSPPEDKEEDKTTTDIVTTDRTSIMTSLNTEVGELTTITLPETASTAALTLAVSTTTMEPSVEPTRSTSKIPTTEPPLIRSTTPEVTESTTNVVTVTTELTSTTMEPDIITAKTNDSSSTPEMNTESTTLKRTTRESSTTEFSAQETTTQRITTEEIITQSTTTQDSTFEQTTTQPTTIQVGTSQMSTSEETTAESSTTTQSVPSTTTTDQMSTIVETSTTYSIVPRLLSSSMPTEETSSESIEENARSTRDNGDPEMTSEVSTNNEEISTKATDTSLESSSSTLNILVSSTFETQSTTVIPEIIDSTTEIEPSTAIQITNTDFSSTTSGGESITQATDEVTDPSTTSESGVSAASTTEEIILVEEDIIASSEEYTTQMTTELTKSIVVFDTDDITTKSEGINTQENGEETSSLAGSDETTSTSNGIESSTLEMLSTPLEETTTAASSEISGELTTEEPGGISLASLKRKRYTTIGPTENQGFLTQEEVTLDNETDKEYTTDENYMVTTESILETNVKEGTISTGNYQTESTVNSSKYSRSLSANGVDGREEGYKYIPSKLSSSLEELSKLLGDSEESVNSQEKRRENVIEKNINNVETKYNTIENEISIDSDNAWSDATEPGQNNPNYHRKSRSVVDYVIARYYDDHYDHQGQHGRRPYAPDDQLSFLVNGKYREFNISFMEYDTVLPFSYLPHLNAMALRFPLDSSRYYLLLVLPVDEDGIDKLICDLRLNSSLKYIISSLQLTHVKAVIPAFMLKGYVVLTPTLQKLGIKRVFEPRQADFSPLTNESGVYVTNIEQAITVKIKNYIDPDTINQNRNLHQYTPVFFKADHPFLYFVIDSDIQVTLMAGKIINPLNTRVR